MFNVILFDENIKMYVIFTEFNNFNKDKFN